MFYLGRNVPRRREKKSLSEEQRFLDLTMGHICNVFVPADHTAFNFRLRRPGLSHTLYCLITKIWSGFVLSSSSALKKISNLETGICTCYAVEWWGFVAIQWNNNHVWEHDEKSKFHGCSLTRLFSYRSPYYEIALGGL